MSYFGYMFQNLRLKPFQPKDVKLIALGNEMLSGLDLGEHPTLPAGYTYLAQFIAHDISFNLVKSIPDQLTNANQVKNGRTSALELNCLYGEGKPEDNVKLYDDTLTCLKVGVTKVRAEGPNQEAQRTYLNDLPREQNSPTAIIGDPRNDENLAVAQTHVAFLRFHNKVVEQVKQEPASNDTLFEKARKKVVQHYQWMILHDFLPRIVEQTALNEALEKVKKSGKAPAKKAPFVPVEFSLAAFRLGHSMLRNTYEWNRYNQSSAVGSLKEAAQLVDLFQFTGSGNMRWGDTALPGNWIIDWTRFFDFTGFNGIATNPKFNLAGKIDTTLASGLKGFQLFLSHIPQPEFQSLPVLDLLRGSRLGLPSGQAVSQALGITPLSASEMLQEPHQSILKRHRLYEETPLWYYILKEAQLYHSGERLGPVGSYIVAKTFVELIQASRYSILNGDNWKPDLGQKKRGEFGMADLLVFAEVVNPLGA